MEWDTKLSERTTKDVIQTKNDIKNKLLPLVFSSEAWTFFSACLLRQFPTQTTVSTRPMKEFCLERKSIHQPCLEEKRKG